MQSTVSVDWTDADLDGTFAAGERTGSIEYLIDNSNFTGYQQTILETVKNAAGQATKRTSYTFGVDEITQTTTLPLPGGGEGWGEGETLTFAHDGHGSVRALFGAAATIAQVFTYSAYGELLAIYNGSGTLQPLASSLTSVLYNGEGFDTRTGLYNFRARNYSASLGRFERLDPFAGNPTDPFSFNKYGFVHGDPVQGIDPTGNEFTISGLVSSIGNQLAVRGRNVASSFNAFRSVRAIRSAIRAYQNVLKIVDKVQDLYDTVSDVMDILSFDPEDLKDIYDQIAGQAGVTVLLAGKREIYIDLPEKAMKKFRDLSNRIFAIAPFQSLAAEAIGEYGLALVAGAFGFEPAHSGWKQGSQGIDQVAYNEKLNVFGVFEAKGGASSRLDTLADGTKQMSHKWIKTRLNDIIRDNSGAMRDKLKGHHQFSRQMVAMVVKVNLMASKDQIKIEAQPYSEGNVPPMVDWTIDK